MTSRLLAFLFAIVTAVVATPSAHSSPCESEPNFQRLAFWIGDWEILDDAGAHYATQRVRPAVGGCAITAEWTGRDGNTGLGLSAFDRQSGEWRQVYVSNQVPSPTGVFVRKSDASYSGPGLRFVSLQDPADGGPKRSRITIMPLAGGRVMQLFENSADAGNTWTTLFKAEHRMIAK